MSSKIMYKYRESPVGNQLLQIKEGLKHFSSTYNLRLSCHGLYNRRKELNRQPSPTCRPKPGLTSNGTIVCRRQGGAIFIHIGVRFQGIVLRKFHFVLTKNLAKGKIITFIVAPTWQVCLVVLKNPQHICIPNLQNSQIQ